MKRAATDILSRFSGAAARRNVLEALKLQDIVAGDVDLARALQKKGSLTSFKARAVLMTQGAADNDVFLILGGSVSIRYHKREIAVRSARTHVGELALADPMARRSATVVAIERTVALKIAEHDFSAIGRKYPDLWRRVAIEVGNRLRERNKHIRIPNSQPVLFIGSSQEGYRTADQIYKRLANAPIVPRVWTEGVFEASQTGIESLVKAADECDFAALVLTADDLTVSRSRQKYSPRDNVIFELGLFIGALGRQRVFILKPVGVDIKIPSDLLGVTCVLYATHGKHSPQRVAARLRQAILKYGPR